MLCHDADLIGGDGGKTFLVLLTGIRSLFDFDHLRWLEHGKTVTTVGKKDHIPRLEDTAFKIGPATGGIDIHAYFSRPDKKDFLSPFHGTGDRIVIMGKYFMPLWMVHIAKLLGKSPRSEKLYAISTVISGNDEGQQLALVPDGNDICHGASLF